MPVPTGPSFFAEVGNCTYVNNGVTVNIFSVKSIRVSRKHVQLKAFDNNKSRAVGVHNVRIDETITIETEDMNAIDSLELTVGPGTLSFEAFAFAHSTTGGTALPNQQYTFTNFVIDSDSTSKPMAGNATGTISGWTMENSAGDATDAFTGVSGVSGYSGAN